MTPNVYLNAHSGLIARPNHLICHLVSCPVSPATLCVKFSSLLVLRSLCVCVCVCVCVCARARARACVRARERERERERYQEPTRKPYVTLLIMNFTVLLPVDGNSECNGPHSHFPVKRAFKIMECLILQLLL